MGVGDGNVTDIVVAAQGRARARSGPGTHQRRRRQLRRDPAGSASSSRRAKKTQQILGQLGVGRARGPSPARAAHVVSCALAMPPSRLARRCLVLLLLLVAVATGVLARPAEAGTRPFAGIVAAAAERHGVDPDLVHAVIPVESGYRTTAQSPAGAQGLMQLMPGTQRDLGVADAFDPRQNVGEASPTCAASPTS